MCRFLPLTLAIDDRRRQADLLFGHLPHCDEQRMVDANQGAVPFPQSKILMHGAPGWQVSGERPPLATGHQYVEYAVQHLPEVHRPLPTTALPRRDQRLHQSPFLIRQALG